ncbi:nitroreductase/quinone reductase family protein [Kitasatospora sp. NPDC101183]|uniref:nitroreductase/quinone reductase family protein n=1 Tax=Kitasatospora sp. NPDC101183 TaxID=3364100 RepID=UPI00382874A1
MDSVKCSRNAAGLGARIAGRVTASPVFVAVAPHVVPALDRTVHRLTGGRKMLLTLVRPREGLVLTSTGARSGLLRETPLACTFDGGTGTWLLVGSNFAKPGHPAWSANLRKHPQAVISWRGERIEVTAAQLTGERREQAWAQLTAFRFLLDAYQRRTARELRVFRLTRRPTATPPPAP